jgi:ankyrin repeat protein
MRSCQKGHLETVRALLGADANKDAVLEGMTVLMWSSWYGHLEIVRALLGAGANKEAKDCDGKTALMLASIRGNLETVQALLSAGADKDAETNGGDTALTLATGEGRAGVVALLKAAGAKAPRARAADEQAALDGQVLRGRTGEVERLLRGGAAADGAKAGNGCTALVFASQKGDLEIVRALLAAGADKDHSCEGNRTALMRASGRGHLKIVYALLFAGADKDAKDESGDSALAWAIDDSRLEVVQALLGAGADVEADKWGPRCVHRALRRIRTALSPPWPGYVCPKKIAAAKNVLAEIVAAAFDPSAMTVPQLKDALRDLGLKQTGKKADLQARLEEAGSGNGRGGNGGSSSGGGGGGGGGGMSAKKPHALSAEEQAALDKQLWDGAETGHVNEVVRLLREGAAPDGYKDAGMVSMDCTLCLRRRAAHTLLLPLHPFASDCASVRRLQQQCDDRARTA